MKPSTNLDNFVQSVMHLNIQHFGMYGGESSVTDVLLSLRESVAGFVGEYNKPSKNHDTLLALSEKIEGCLRTLQVFNVITEAETDKLIDTLRTLQ
jgi:hypothetical protein